MKLLFFYLILINLIGSFAMYSDKQRAIKGKYRIAESTLWLLTLIGGAIGTTAGMKLFRHKTKHAAFKYGFPFIALIQIVIFAFSAYNFT